MAYRTFGVGPARGLGRAEARELPNLVVIAGPNGAGKSTLLEELRNQATSAPEPGTRVLWIGPHRGWDQLNIQRSVLWEGPPEPLIDSLTQRLLPGMQVGWQYGQIVKTYLVRLHAQQRIVQDEVIDRLGPNETLRRSGLPDLFEPFKQLVASLLPHLRFKRVVDVPSESAVQCLFGSADSTEGEFDLEMLSSGEKATIALFLPLLEARADQARSEQGQAPSPNSAPAVPLTVLIDEVDQHLHPLLQLQVLHYLRDLARDNVAQFIVATHSPTLLDAATDDELYLLSPAALRPGENQLTRLTTSQERLEVARELTGSTHLLTRAKPIVFVEGEPDRRGVASDAHLITLLLPPTATWALVSTRSRTEVESAVRRLRHDHLELPGTPVFGLVDTDRNDATGDDHVITWPVAMIENLLLDAEAIYEALRPFGKRTQATSVRRVQDALDRAAAGRADDEVRLRLEAKIRPRTPHVGVLTVDDIDDLGRLAAHSAQQVQHWLAQLRALDVAALRADAQAEVDGIIAANQQLDRFRGKEILDAVHRRLGVAGVIKRSDLPSVIAIQAATRPRTRRLTTTALQRITLYFPADLAQTLRDAGAEGLASECDTHRTAWGSRGGSPIAAGRQELRRGIFEFARTVDDQDRREHLVRLAAEIGTP